MNRMQSGSMPSMEEIMSDPSLRELCVLPSTVNTLFLNTSLQSKSVWPRWEISV